MVEASGGAITTLRAERDNGTSGLNKRACRDRIKRLFESMRDDLATINAFEIQKATAEGTEPPLPSISEDVMAKLRECEYPWQTAGAAASALPHLAARYRDADAEASPPDAHRYLNRTMTPEGMAGDFMRKQCCSVGRPTDLNLTGCTRGR
jgi:hypothetical protein